MAEVTFEIQMERSLKNSFERICRDAGVDMPTMICLFAKKAVQEGKVPDFLESELIRERGLKAFHSLREQALKDFPNGMSLEEINEEIAKVRNGEKDE